MNLVYYQGKVKHVGICHPPGIFFVYFQGLKTGIFNVRGSLQRSCCRIVDMVVEKKYEKCRYGDGNVKIFFIYSAG